MIIVVVLRLLRLLLGLTAVTLIAAEPAMAGERDGVLELAYTDFPRLEKTRDPWLWPYASDSPWNTPIGTPNCTRCLAYSAAMPIMA